MKLYLKMGMICVLAAVVSAGNGVEAGQSSERYQAPGTRRMAQLLEEIAGKVDPMQNPFLNASRAEVLRKRSEEITGPEMEFEVRGQLPVELLNAGRSEEALVEFAKFEELLRARNLLEVPENRDLLRFYQALAHLRLGEQDNCLALHNPDSCLFPIQGGGIHQNERGSRAAIGVLTNFLPKAPSDLSARWLLNIAYMTLGEYPDKVPARWLISPQAFQSEYDIKRFPQVAGELGLDVEGLSGGSVVEDFDGDGYLDVMISSLGFKDPLRLFRNNGDGTFTERTEAAGLMGVTGGLNLIQADYNNDGFPDLLVLRGAWMGNQGRFPNSLLRNNGDGTFADVTEEAGLLNFRPTQTAVWLDYNLDGQLDLFIGNESTSREVHPCELFRNNGDGTFTECAAETGVAFVGFVKGVAAGDFNNDGRPDLYLSCLDRPNALFRNEGSIQEAGGNSVWKFKDVGSVAGVRHPFYSFPTWFWDYDNDGWLDLFVAGYRISGVGDIAADYLGLPHRAERARLYRNLGNGTFQDVTRQTGLYKVLHAMGCNFGDLDNDGFLDFYIGTGDPDLSTLVPNRMFRNAEGNRFQEVTTSGGFGHLQKGHGISFGDLDNDGDQDIYEDMGGAYTGDIARNVLFQNPGHGNRWITLKLEGVKANRSAIGARIKIEVATASGPRTIYKTVGSGGSFGASPLRAEIGLGAATAIRSLEIAWPNGEKPQAVAGLEMDRFWHIREGENPRLLEWKSFPLARKKD